MILTVCGHPAPFPHQSALRTHGNRQEMGVVSSNWFDRVLLSVTYTLKPSCPPMFKPPSLGPPQSPVNVHVIYIYIYIYIIHDYMHIVRHHYMYTYDIHIAYTLMEDCFSQTPVSPQPLSAREQQKNIKVLARNISKRHLPNKAR